MWRLQHYVIFKFQNYMGFYTRKYVRRVLYSLNNTEVIFCFDQNWDSVFYLIIGKLVIPVSISVYFQQIYQLIMFFA